MIGVQCIFQSHESRHQHQQRAFRQVKIGQQQVTGLEPITRFDENARHSLSGMDDALVI